MKYIIPIMILSLVLLSCAKKDDEDSSSSSITYSTSTSGVTASGTMTIGSDTISGTYGTMCVSASDSSPPTDVTHIGFVAVVTGDQKFTRETNYYTDSTCTSISVGWYYNNDNASIGDASGSDYKMTYIQDDQTFMPKTTAGDTWLTAFWSAYSLDFEVGTAKVIDTDTQMYNLVRVSGGKLYFGSESTSAYPSTGGEAEYVKQ